MSSRGSGISFNDLRTANLARLPQFKNAKGEPAHSEPNGSDWTLADWLQATVGELGELANILKKVKRGDISMQEALPEIANEFADVATYLDIFAMRAGVNLGEATMSKFNEVSRRVGAEVFFDDKGNVVETDTHPLFIPYLLSVDIDPLLAEPTATRALAKDFNT